MKQHTLKTEISIKGVGLHSGRKIKATLKPANPDTGIIFVRADLDGAPEIKAHFKNVSDTRLATTLGSGKVTVSTVEHLLSALYGMRVDNVIVELSGAEVPIMDGSSAPWVNLMIEAGVVEQRASRYILQVTRRVEVNSEGKYAVALPANGLEIQTSIEWDHPMIGFQELHYQEGVTPYSDIADARTFGFVRDVEQLRQMGLIQGGSLDNAVVLNDAGVLNPEGLRHSDEFVRHKVLDALGDFKLAGVNIHAAIRLHRSGHDLHYKLIEAILSDKDNYRLVEEGRRPARPTREPMTAVARTGRVPA